MNRVTPARAERRLLLRLASGAAAWLCVAATVGAQTPLLTNAEYDRLSAAVDEVVVGATVCDVGVLPESSARPATIIGVVDFSGRLYCNIVVRVSWTTPPVLLQEISGWWVGSLNPGSLEVIQDVDGDGQHELVVPTAISDYEGRRACMATLPHVYRCDDRLCIDASDHAPDFFRRWRAERAERLRDADAANDEAMRRTIPCLQMEMHKADRLSGASPAASLRLADEWAGSSDPYLRRKAVWVLSDLWVESGVPTIKRRLERLGREGHDYARIVKWLETRKRAGAP